MQQFLSRESHPYTGHELRSHWIRETFGVPGDAIVAFIGPCEVPTEALVDLADVAARSYLRAALMLHVIMERFDVDLVGAVLRQRLLVALAAETLQQARPQCMVQRRGDDLYVGDRKLSVSIATVSPVSTLIHLGINVDPWGAPVPAIGLEELGVEPTDYAARLLAAFVAEEEGVQEARAKVRGVP